MRLFSLSIVLNKHSHFFVGLIDPALILLPTKAMQGFAIWNASRYLEGDFSRCVVSRALFAPFSAVPPCQGRRNRMDGQLPGDMSALKHFYLGRPSAAFRYRSAC